MPQIVQAGQINLAALSVPDLIVQIIPPQLLINGVPSNIIGFVGTATWGPRNTPQIVGGYQGYTAQFGLPQPRKYDMGTALWNASQQGAQAFRCIRITDGTDTAASVTIQTNCITLTSLWTGTTGNSIAANIQPGSAQSSFKAIISLGSLVPEVFDNITYGVTSFNVTPGTYTVCPTSLTIGAPTLPALGIQAAAAPILVVQGTPAVAAGGANYAVNDLVNLPNGVVLKVATLSGSAIASVTVQNAGIVTAGQTVPTNPVAQQSTSGSGTGATFTLTWGLGQPVISQGGAGYTSTPPAVTINGGTFSVAGSLVAVVSPWVNMANAINLGQSTIRTPSTKVVATAGVGTSAPTTAAYSLAGGTDGASPSNIATTGTPFMVGQDVIPRTGMYAMRSALISIGVLVDVDDTTTWTTQVAFGLSEAIYMIATGPAGDTIANATNVKALAGIDSYTIKIMFGDWIYINDPVTGVQRLTSPQGFIAGIMGNQSPNQSPLNKQLNGIVATQKSTTTLPYANADLQALAAGQIDVITNPCPGGNYFGCRLGINASSNLAINGDNYTRMTYFIARTISQGCGIYVGQLQTPQERLQAKTTLSAFFQNLVFLQMIGTVDGSDPFQVTLDTSNNPQNLVALGYQFAYVKVVYLSVIRYFIIDLEGGQTVTILNQLPTGITGTTGAGAVG
jgi:uncharacterized protein